MEVSIIQVAQRYSDEDKARELMESLRWPDGPECPHCESKIFYEKTPKRYGKHAPRKGLYRCGDCKSNYSVTVGTVMEGTRIPLAKWVMAIFLISAAKKGISALQLKRMMEPITYKSAWFMYHRIRHMMTESPEDHEKMTGVVEADETYIGGKRANMHKSKRKKLKGRGTAGKAPVFALVERDGRLVGHAVANVTGENLREIMREHVSPEARIMTDEHASYQGLSDEYAEHRTVNHSSGEYVNEDAHTNTIEGAFGLFKRQIVGAHHHVSTGHLGRYWDEFAYKYNRRDNEVWAIVEDTIRDSVGKRLMYRIPTQPADSSA